MALCALYWRDYSAQSKRLVYTTMAVGESGLIAVFLGNWLAQRETGLQRGALVKLALGLGPVLVWRGWCLGWMGRWFEDEDENPNGEEKEVEKA